MCIVVCQSQWAIKAGCRSRHSITLKILTKVMVNEALDCGSMGMPEHNLHCKTDRLLTYLLICICDVILSCFRSCRDHKEAQVCAVPLLLATSQRSQCIKGLVWCAGNFARGWHRCRPAAHHWEHCPTCVQCGSFVSPPSSQIQALDGVSLFSQVRQLGGPMENTAFFVVSGSRNRRS